MPDIQQMKNHFPSLGATYIFILLIMDGRARSDALGIKQEHFEDKSKATAWRDSIQQEITSIHSPEEEDAKAQALGELNRLYRLMTNAANSN
jgi:hypothetical protein